MSEYLTLTHKKQNRLFDMIHKKIKDLELQFLLREPPLIQSRKGKYVTISQRRLTSFASNDYLGLSAKQLPTRHILKSIEKFSAGTGASRLIQGNTTIHEEAEQRFARFKGQKFCTMFNSAYNANIGLIQSLSDENTTFFSDELNHASIIDGLRFAKSNGSKTIIYNHCDANDLEEKIRSNYSEKKFIITETLFSMEGDISPVKEIERIGSEYGAIRIYDEAHSTGIYGKNGAGLLDELNINNSDIIVVSNLAKAGGLIGGFVTSNVDLKPILYSTARPLIFTTSLPAFICAAMIEIVKLIEKAGANRKKLRENISYASKLFRTHLINETASKLKKSKSPIISYVVGDNQKALMLHKELLTQGFFVPCLRPPSAPKDTARLRVSISALHIKHDLDTLVGLIKRNEEK